MAPLFIWFASFFDKNTKKAPIRGKNVIDDKIGKFIILLLKNLIVEKIQLT